MSSLSLIHLLLLALALETARGSASCAFRECPSGQVCRIGGKCESLTCPELLCRPGTTCVNNQCVGSLECTSSSCSPGYTCVDRQCRRDCWTKGSRIRNPCPTGNICVINNFGNPPIDIPNRGACYTAVPLWLCSGCKRNSGSTLCYSSEERDAMTCGLYCTRYKCQ